MKLTCIITGKEVTINKERLEQKIEEQGSLVNVQNTYVSREAKGLLKKGFTVDQIREYFDVQNDNLPEIPQEILQKYMYKPYQFKDGVENKFQEKVKTYTIDKSEQIDKFFENLKKDQF